MLYEVRHYVTQPGRRDEWVRHFEEKIVPFEVAHDVVVIGSFVDTESDDGFTWIRAFVDEKQRDEFGALVASDPTWVKEIGPTNGALLQREKTTASQLHPTTASALQ
jgi:hypothetical protein